MLFLFFMYFLIAHTTITNTTRAIIIDSEGKHEYYYNTLWQIAHCCNFNCDYKNIYDILENPTIDPCYHAAFIFVSGKVLRNPQHAITQDFIKTVIPFTNQKNSTTMFFLPCSTAISALSSFLSYMPLPSNINPTSLAQLYIHHIGAPNAQSGHIASNTLKF